MEQVDFPIALGYEHDRQRFLAANSVLSRKFEFLQVTSPHIGLSFTDYRIEISTNNGVRTPSYLTNYVVITYYLCCTSQIVKKEDGEERKDLHL